MEILDYGLKGCQDQEAKQELHYMSLYLIQAPKLRDVMQITKLRDVMEM